MKSHGWLMLGCLAAVVGCRTGANLSQVETQWTQPSELDSAGDLTEPTDAAAPADGDIMRVAYRQPQQDLPQPPTPDNPPQGGPELIDTPQTLALQDVILSVQDAYPLLLNAALERQVASGKQLSAWGEFDLGLKAFGIAAPEGFYQTYRNGIGLEQPVFQGGYVFGGYKIGDGNFQPWFGERETNEGGEFSAGFGVPLLKDRSIDKRRESVFKASLARQAVEPAVRAQLLEFVRAGSQAYWTWVASGRILAAHRELLRLARDRVDQVEESVKAGDLPEIARINNQQLIASRETKVIEADRKLQQAAIKLSLFLRDLDGRPIVPDVSLLPRTFPRHYVPNSEQLDADIAQAIAVRPELVELDLISEQVRVELAQAENLLFPKLDARLLASKDVGARASSKGDKTPFELEVGLFGEVPLQRRAARGKIDAARGKLAQIETKRRFVVDKVTAAVQDAVSALAAAAGRIERATSNLTLARQTLALGRVRFNAGDADLIALNIYEQAVTDAQILLIAAQADFFIAVADYRAALSLDPVSSDE